MGDIREAEAPAAIFEGRRVDQASADASKDPGRHAPQRTSAIGQTVVSVRNKRRRSGQSTCAQCRLLDRWRAKFRRNALRRNQSMASSKPTSGPGMTSELPVTRPESRPATPRRECYRQVTTAIPDNMELAPRKGANSQLPRWLQCAIRTLQEPGLGVRPWVPLVPLKCV